MKIVKIIFIALLIFNFSYAADIGSDMTIQDHYYFTFGEDNRIANDAIMDNGFTLTNKNGTNTVATCTWDSYFPASGLVNLNGGWLYMNNDINMNNVSSLGSAGIVYGNGYKIEFPAYEKNWGVPAVVDRSGRLRFLSLQEGAPEDVYSVSWSYDGNYVASGGLFSIGAEIRIFKSTNGFLSSLLNGAPIGTVYSNDWHPDSYYLAACNATGANPYTIYLYLFDPSDNSLTLKDSLDIGATSYSCAWSTDGKYLGVLTDHRLWIYSFSKSTETLSLVDNISFGGNGTPYYDALDWRPNEYDLVFGTTSENADVLVYHFDGSSLSITTSIHIPGISQVYGVSWKNDEDLIAVVMDNTSENLRVYEYTQDHQLVEKDKWTDSADFYAVDWNPEGNNLSATKDNTAESQVEVFYYNKNAGNLLKIDGYTTGVNTDSVRFSPNGRFVAAGDRSRNLTTYDLNQNKFLFDNTNLVLNSESEFIVTTTFRGQCSINGNGNRLHLSENAAIKIESGSQLTLQNLDLVGLAGSNIQCLSDGSSIIIQDCKLTLTNHYTFGLGSILFKGDNIFSGTCKFVYETTFASTIDKNSLLYFDQGTTFSYAPTVANRDLIYMEDESSGIYFDGCSVNSTKTGLRLTRGRLFIDNLVEFNAEGSSISEAICLGNGVASGDINVTVLSGAYLDVSGPFEYQNTI